MIKDLKKILPHIRFWLWGAMHYERFDQFQILLLPPVWIAPNYFHKATKEMIVIVGLRIPQIAIIEPTYADIYRNNPWDRIPQIDWGEDLLPF